MADLLRLENLSKRFGSLTVTDDLSLRLGQDEALGILGPNGAGKSTLFNLIVGSLKPNAGRIHFLGADITSLTPHARCRRGIGRSYQIPHPFAKMTVFENLLVAASFAGGRAEAECYDHCIDLLARTGLLAKANRPAGRLTLLERKRLELAHAAGTAIIWIEHVVHALLAVVGRLVVINFGRLLAEGEPRRVMADPAVQDVYLGIDAA